MRSITSVLFSVLPLLLGTLCAAAQERALEEEAATTKRIALLIGNGSYDQKPPAPEFKELRLLNNPCRDVEAVAALLEASGWNPDTEIILRCDVPRKDVKDAVDNFKDVYLSSDRSFGFIYYAGHGIQVGKETYLFGTDSWLDLQRATELADDRVPGSIFRGGVRLYADIISQVGDAGTGSIFIVIDACRETPIDQILKQKGITVAGGAYPKPVVGVKLLFSTAFGELSSDGLTSGSPFSIAFVEHLEQVGNVDLLVSHVVQTVSTSTATSSIPQVPDTTGSLNPPPPNGCLTKCGDQP
ncbi:caspase domain-containing protein [Sinorhizobium meliloti]|uniref:caspase family protein n=1 Tax=Rhizobium meliloti TaxID=382 RepID=UPI003D64F6C8